MVVVRNNCRGDSFARYCVIILFSSCCLLKYDMLSEIMGPIYSRNRTFTAICYQRWLCPEFENQFRDIIFHIIDNELKFEKKIHVYKIYICIWFFQELCIHRWLWINVINNIDISHTLAYLNIYIYIYIHRESYFSCHLVNSILYFKFLIYHKGHSTK